MADRNEAIPAIAEVFREHGFEGASLALITAKTGLGKGSLYNFFPGGKQEMATEVLAHIHDWFEKDVFTPLLGDDPAPAVRLMMLNVASYFRSGQRICLVGAFALGETRDHFAGPIHRYFRRWIDSLQTALERAGLDAALALRRAETSVVAIQGALVLARALRDDAVFTRALEQIAADLLFDRTVRMKSRNS